QDPFPMTPSVAYVKSSPTGSCPVRLLRRDFVCRALLALVALAGMGNPRPAGAQQLYEDFVIAATNDRAVEVKSMLARGMDPNTVAQNGDPVLLIAARAGFDATLDVLLAARGVNVNARSRFGDTA